MNWYIAWLKSVLPQAGAQRITVGEKCTACGGNKQVSRIAIHKIEGPMGALYLCEACIEGIKTMV